jgi:hypothetical protein
MFALAGHRNRGYSSGLGLALRVLGLEGQKVWVEDPGFPFSRRGLELARLSLAPIPVDASGIDVDHGLRHAPDAKLVIVTPGSRRRSALLYHWNVDCVCSIGPLKKACG